MENEIIEDIITPENNDDIELEEEQKEVTPEKPVETPEAKLARLERQLAQQRKKLGIKEETPKVESKKSADVDYGLEAYLVANGVKEADERELFNKRMNDGQKPLEILGNKYFQEELKELRESKAVKDALPSNSKRANPSAKDTVEYWKAKIDSGSATLMDVTDTKLRREIVNSNINTAKNVNHFTNNPFGGLELPKK